MGVPRDRVPTARSTTFDIDHLVPLGEVWDSGGKRWTGDTRARYANDLGDRRTLVAVIASSNRSKDDQDPAEWMPDLAGCKYINQWVAVKLRWRLSIDAAERSLLMLKAEGCRDVTVAVQRARIQLAR